MSTETETGICASLKFEVISTQPEINSSFRGVKNVVFVSVSFILEQ